MSPALRWSEAEREKNREKGDRLLFEKWRSLGSAILKIKSSLSPFLKMSTDEIVIHGAKVHNLKNISLRLPRDKLIVITGLSGSGKSSLAFDTIYAEGQRRYVESLSSYARQFLEQLAKPDVEYIQGLSPAISIEQRTAGGSPRSTVATQTEVYDYLRLLFARIGTVYCYGCAQPISRQSADEIIKDILTKLIGGRIEILAPLIRGKKGEYRDTANQVQKAGFARVRVDGIIYGLELFPRLDKYKLHNIDVVVDRLIIRPAERKRLADSVETALKVGKGIVIIASGGKDYVFSQEYACSKCGISYAEVQPRIFSFNSPYGACPACNGLGCPQCHGSRLKKEALSVQIEGLSIYDAARMSIADALIFFENLKLNDRQRQIAHPVLKEIRLKLKFCIDMGLDYLTLDRLSSTLSGGEAQRIRLATQVGSGLVGVLYILDEPSIGLHRRDSDKLITTLKALRDLGNTLIVVEHDEQAIRSSDWVVDLGPGAGRRGGEIIFNGPISELCKCRASLTAKYLNKELRIHPSSKPRAAEGRNMLKIIGASEHNLKSIEVEIPLGLFVCISGVSGSGKSTLIYNILYPALMQKLFKSKMKVGRYRRIEGYEFIDKVIVVDQSPIGRTPRSNPATYTGAYSHIRDIFARLPESKVRGYKPGRFSFNLQGGRCEACMGDGIKKIEMHFLPPVYVRCEVCQGRRFNEQTLEARYKGKSIADALEMTVLEVRELFGNIPKIKNILDTLYDVGLGYIQLGQSATTLSGGEAQRVKLSSELSKRATGRTLYILDEPTTGLHFADVDKLLSVLHRLVEKGNTVIVIEHNLDVVKACDYIIDLGPEGGDAGGEVVACGSPFELAKNTKSYTGSYLKKVLNPC